MLIILHVISALLSIGLATFTLLYPSKAKLRLSYGLVTTTFISGTYLVISRPTSLSAACVTGLVYLSAIAVLLFPARRKLTQLG